MQDKHIEDQILEIIEYIKEAAESNGLKGPGELAEKAGFHSQQVSNWLNHGSSPTLKNLLRLLFAGGVTMELKAEGLSEVLVIGEVEKEEK